MIAAIFTGKTDIDTEDAELLLARRLFAQALRGWPPPHVVSVPSIAALVEIAPRLLPANTPADARILFFAHDLLLPAPGCIEKLAQALDTGLPCAAACDAGACGGGDYLTLRGFERFALAHSEEAMPQPVASHEPLAFAARLSALANGSWRRAPRIKGAWVHDFSGYRTYRREELLTLLPTGCASLLDVGGGTGGFLAAAKERLPNCQTTLVEMSPTACALACRNGIDRIWHGDFLTLDIVDRFACISFLDVLEHTAEPLAMLAKARSLLTQGGCIIASIPNIGHWSIIADLLEGRWDYAPTGILCITHLRFFTRKTIEQWFAEAGLCIEAWHAERLPPPSWFDLGRMSDHLKIDPDSLATVAWHFRARVA